MLQGNGNSCLAYTATSWKQNEACQKRKLFRFTGAGCAVHLTPVLLSGWQRSHELVNAECTQVGGVKKAKVGKKPKF